MKINDFASQVTRIEAGEKQLNVAQVSEVLKIVNSQLWGIPYFLIRIKGNLDLLLAAILVLAVLVASFFCLGGQGKRLTNAPAPVELEHADDCQGNTPPIAIIETTQVMGAAA